MAFRLLLVSVLSSFALIPLTTQHFFASSDGLYHIHRSIEVHQCLKSGVLICRWMPDQYLGYGTPLLNLYSPAVYYVIAAFYEAGLGWVNATKASMAVFMIFSGIAAYGYALDFLSRRGALLASVVYVYVPYHLVNAYYRGDLPEFFAMGWFPAILWAFGRIVRPGTLKQRLPYVVAAAVCYAGLVLTHNLSAFIYTGVLMVYCAFLLLRGIVEKRWGWLGAFRPAALLLGATLLAYALTAYLSFPAILEKHLIQLEGLLYVSHQDHFPTLKEIMPNRIIHIYGIIFPESPEYAYKMGLVQVVLGGLGALVALLCYRRFTFRARGEAVISVVVFCVAFWFTRPPSLWAWDSIPLLPFAQFPWRFLLLMALPTSVLTGFLVDVWPERIQRFVLPVLVVFTLLTNTLGLRPIMANTVEGDIDEADATRFELMYHLLGTTVAGEYVPRWAKDKAFISPEALAIVLGQDAPDVHVPTSDRGIEVHRTLKSTNEQTFTVNAQNAGRIVLNTVYFPGWRAEVNGQTVELGVTSPEGLIAVGVPAGQSRVRIVFENTPIRTQGELVSLAAVIVCLLLLAYAWVRVPHWRFALPRVQISRPLAARAVLLVALLALMPFGVAFYAAAYQPPPLAQRPLKINVGDTAMLLGYDLRVNGQLLPHLQPVEPGTVLELSTYWEAIQRDAERLARSQPYARLSNIDEQNWGFVVEERRQPLTADGFTFRSDTRLLVPNGLPPGVYQIDLGLFVGGRPQGVKNMELVELLPTQGSIRVGPVQVKAGGAFANLPQVANQTFSQHVRLESFDVQLGLNDRRPRPSPVPIEGSPAVATLPAGETLQLDMLWRSLQDHPGVFIVNATLDDAQGFRWATREVEPVDRMYPSWMWSDQELIRDQIRLEIPPEAPPGRYILNLKLFDRGRPLPVMGANGLPQGTQAKLIDVQILRTEAQAREREVKILERKRQKLSDDLELLGNSLGESEVSAGGELELALIWRALRDVPKEYQARLRIIGERDRVAGELVVPPTGVGNPTNIWERNDIFRGQYRVPIDRAAASGNARLVVELLDPATNQAVGRAEIGRVTVKGR
ncbi:MAG: hypothetical protein IT306_28110 [Chloroflexi bacterium]|nr:hypothetical protein [Chloroflexota bacterium]